MRHCTLLLTCALLLAGVPAAAKNDKDNGKGNGNKHGWSKHTDKGWNKNTDREMRRGTNRGRVNDDYDYGMPRRTEGHRPHDLNGDGRVTRNEWPGNDTSFRQLDRDGDGVISRYDRELRSDRRDSTHRSRTDRFSGLDRNRDGRLTQREWNVSGRSFYDYDHDRNGVITRDEFPF